MRGAEPDTQALRAPRPPRAGVRPEIQALRAFAVGSVLANHLWPDTVRGGFIGVDVFFVVSGFLISGQLFREVRETGTIKLRAFWARRARRILPAALVVLTAVLIGTALFLPITRWVSTLGEIIASAVYVENWHLIGQSVNYFTSANAPSPIVHFWSLSIEEQFYIVWPLIFLAASFLRGRRTTVAILVAIGVLFTASIAYGVMKTADAPSEAYFSTLVRAWEFMAGGALAYVLSTRRLSGRLAIVSGWVGWATLAFGLLAINETTSFPGYAALVPVVGAVLVVIGGSPRGIGSLTRVVSWRPIQFVGDISYGVYLWHWPLIVIAPFVIAHPLGTTSKIAVIIVSLAAAWVMKRFLEDPVRRAGSSSRPVRVRRGSVAGVVAFAAALIFATGAVSSSVGHRTDAMLQTMWSMPSAHACLGAQAMLPDADCPDSHRLADEDAVLVNSANQGNPVANGSSCQQEPSESTVLTCDFGTPAATATRFVALTGDSHAGHWVEALDVIARAHGWNVTMYLKSACPSASGAEFVSIWNVPTRDNCAAWRQAAVDDIAKNTKIDLVIASSFAREYGMYDANDAPLATSTAGAYEASWKTWIAAGKKVFVIGDTPRNLRGDIPTCLAEHRHGNDPCAESASDGLSVPDPLLEAAAQMKGVVGSFDPSPYICDAKKCHAVVGGLPVRADADHLNGAFARTFAPFLWTAIESSPAR